MKRKVLIMTSFYIPSVKAGGPIQSIKNIVDNLSDKIDFYIVTSDRDLGDSKPFENIIVDEWIHVGKAKVFYTEVSKLTWKKTVNILNGTKYDVLYLNSFFSYKFSIVPLILNRMKKLDKKPIVLAPRGEFSKGALGLKRFKKEVYTKTSKILNLYKNVKWHATNKQEKKYIQKTIKEDIDIEVARNLTGNYMNKRFVKTLKKNKGELKLVYISRIHPIKNIYQVLEILQQLELNINFYIYGPIEDETYWEKCKILISKMNDSVSVFYMGPITNDKVYEIYQQNHVAILLTLGENFGHSISEALIGGCPVIISDQTPWRQIDKYNVGWDLSLNNYGLIAQKIRYFVELDEKQYKEMSRSAFEYAKIKSNVVEDIGTYYKMFRVN